MGTAGRYGVMSDEPAGDETGAFSDDAFRKWMEEHVPSPPLSAEQPPQSTVQDLENGVAVPDLTAMRGRMDQFKALGVEVASVVADFRTALRNTGIVEEDVVYYSRMWSTAYLNLIWSQVLKENFPPS